jgi:hypothetical protein
MKKLLSAICVLCAMWAQSASAGSISDLGSNAYWGGDDHGKGDLIGASTYDIMGATITRAGSVLTIVVNTNFAGMAGSETIPGVSKGIGYGDVFLSDVWNPVATNAHYTSDSAKATGTTLWKWGLSIGDANRYNNSGGTFTLFQLNGATNDANLKLSQDYLGGCSGCTYRNDQAAAVDTYSSTVKNMGVTGTWTVDSNKDLVTFKIDISSVAALMQYTNFAMHWGETCNNDVLEGITRVVPTPGSLPLLAIGLAALLTMRRREKFSFFRKS